MRWSFYIQVTSSYSFFCNVTPTISSFPFLSSGVKTLPFGYMQSMVKIRKTLWQEKNLSSTFGIDLSPHVENKKFRIHCCITWTPAFRLQQKLTKHGIFGNKDTIIAFWYLTCKLWHYHLLKHKVAPKPQDRPILELKPKGGLVTTLRANFGWFDTEPLLTVESLAYHPNTMEFKLMPFFLSILYNDFFPLLLLSSTTCNG